MKISFRWLKSLIDFKETPEELSELLTNTGLEVEYLEKYSSVKGGLDGLIVGEVLTCEQHPNADRLKITTVNIGNDVPLHIVCGAPNVATGQKVIVATIGTVLYPTTGDSFVIQKSKIRGELSEGMLCAEDEIGVGESHAGIIVLSKDIEVGTKASELYQVYDDYLIEIGLTANRGDAASHLGVARDIKAVTGNSIQIPTHTISHQDNTGPIDVSIEYTDACMQYCGLYIENIEIKPSPNWLQDRLKVIGLKPINNIVDASNYILHELGQPTHVFDADKIQGGKIRVVRAQAEDNFTTLDGIERKLKGSEAMIADANHNLALAGVFGGKESGVSDQTKNIFLESACFDPIIVRKTAKLHTISTDSSFRFERGTDPNLPYIALQNLASLITEIAGGKCYKPIQVISKEFTHHSLTYDIIKAQKLIGKEIPKDEIIHILKKLDFKILNDQSDIIQIQVPSYRLDIIREADVTEEVLRIYGLNNIEFPESINISIDSSSYEQEFQLQNKISNMLCDQGFHEMMSNSLVPENWSLSTVSVVRLSNPLSNELSTLRTNLLYNTLESISYNRNRKNLNLKLYEFGKIYQTKESQFIENSILSLCLTGEYYADSWQKLSQQSNFYHLKKHINHIGKLLGLDVFEYSEIQHPFYQECYQISINKCIIGELGYVHENVLTQFDMQESVVFAELNWQELILQKNLVKVQYVPVSKFPEVKRDLSLVLDNQVTFGQLQKLALQSSKKLLKSVDIFDIYIDAKLGEGKKSYALSFYLGDDEKTLDDATIDQTMKQIINRFEKEVGAIIRS